MKQYDMKPLDGCEPEIGAWLWGLEEVRHRYTLRIVQDLDPRLVDWEGPDGSENAIGSLLFHIAAVEMAWLWGEVMGRTTWPAEIEADFAVPGMEPSTPTRLDRVRGLSLQDHLDRMHRSRSVFLREMRGLSITEWRRLRLDPQDQNYEVTPAWVVFHLIEHESAHAGQISSLKARGMRMVGEEGREGR